MRTEGRSSNRRGASLALVAVTMVGLLASMALALDLGILFKTRGEARRAADAAALAGASAFLTKDFTDPEAIPLAEARAMELATSNYMTGGLVQPAEVTIEVIPADQRVRVTIIRQDVQTWFARFFNVFSKPIGAVAMAEATQAGTSRCVKPFLIPDNWHEGSGEDIDNDRIWDLPSNPGNGNIRCGRNGIECWSFDPSAGDRYERFDEEAADRSTQTGLGSAWRASALGPQGGVYQGDIGRPIMLYPSSPQNSPTPSNFYLWRIECPGGNCVRDAMVGCTNSASVGDMIAAEQPGGVVGPVSQGFDEWMAMDEGATFEEWVEDGIQRWRINSPNGYTGLSSPRVFISAIMAPTYLAPGYDEVPINNLAMFFLEDAPRSPGDKKPAVVRFLGFAPGLGPEDPNTGTLVKTLRLVQ